MWYQRREEAALVDASGRYDAALAAYDQNDVAKGNALIEELKREYPKSI